MQFSRALMKYKYKKVMLRSGRDRRGESLHTVCLSVDVSRGQATHPEAASRYSPRTGTQCYGLTCGKFQNVAAANCESV